MVRIYGVGFDGLILLKTSWTWVGNRDIYSLDFRCACRSSISDVEMFGDDSLSKRPMDRV